MDEQITLDAGLLRGPWVRPRNISGNMLGSIHEQNTAVALGMRGALVTGRLLNVAFVPVLLRAFGQRWFERGTLSMEYRSGVIDDDQLRPVLGEPPAGARDVQVQAWLERPNGEVVSRGTASAGDPSEQTWLGAMDPAAHDTGGYRVVGGLAPGDRFPRTEVMLTMQHARRWEAGLASSPWFTGPSPWGGPIASPAVEASALTAGCTAYRSEHPVAGVPVDGAIELRNINGPVFLDRTYHVTSGVIGRGQSPRTEYIWYESALDDDQGRRIAEMRMKLRFMKESAALLAPTRAAG